MQEILSVYRSEIWRLIIERTAKKQALGWIVFIVMFGVFIPMSQAEFWIRESQLLSLHLIFVPLMITYTCTASSFAGDRNGDVKLGSGLSDHSIFLGKALAGFVFSYFSYLFIVFTGLIALNYVIYVTGGWQGVFLYSAPTMFAFLFHGAGLVLFAVGTGVYISHKVDRIKTAQLLGSVLYLIIGLPVISGLVKIVFTWDLVMPVFLIILLVDAAVFAAAARVFKKSRLLCSLE